MSRLSTWLRDRLIGPPDPTTQRLVEAVREGTTRLADATEHLAEELQDIKKARERHPRGELAGILDDVLRQVERKDGQT